MEHQYRYRDNSDVERPKLALDKVELHKDKVLGIGAYGKVCRARYNCLPCAAKIIHETLYWPPNTPLPQYQYHSGQRLPLERFEQEIEFLGRISHPNIVHHIGVYRDPETLGPVLLMELLKCNLTDFLQKNPSGMPLSYCTQVNISHDVSLALAYLHSVGISHRDLSSNNILMGRGDIAKVSDFGMAKLNAESGQRSQPPHLTTCPGTEAYMPPEAVEDKPRYTEKIDCFSFGVVVIQIMTRLYPAPGDRRKKMHIDHPDIPVKDIEVPVKEIDRRQNHITKIEPNHPLLSIALRCLADVPNERPTATNMCEEIEKLKESQEYNDESLIREQPLCDLTTSSYQDQELKKQQYQEERNECVQTSSSYPIEDDYVVVGESGHENESNDEQATASGEDQKQLPVSEYGKGHFEEETGNESEENQATPNTSGGNLKFNWKRGAEAPSEMYRYSNSVIYKDTAYILPANMRKIFAYNTTDRLWSHHASSPYLGSSLSVINDHLTTIGGKRVEMGYRYALNTTAGYASSYTDRLCTYAKQTGSKEVWSEKFPRMPTKRAFTTALNTEANVIVAGGVGGDILSTIEILNTITLQWMTAAEMDLPQPMWAVSATLCGDNVYVLGGVDRNGAGLSAVYKCSLETLLQCCRPNSLSSLLSSVFTLKKPMISIWEKIENLSVTLSTSASVNGHLLAIGGKDCSSSKSASRIHLYDESEDRWIPIDHLPTPVPRYSCFVFNHPENESLLHIVGGKTSGERLTKEMNLAFIY